MAYLGNVYPSMAVGRPHYQPTLLAVRSGVAKVMGEIVSADGRGQWPLSDIVVLTVIISCRLSNASSSPCDQCHMSLLPDNSHWTKVNVCQDSFRVRGVTFSKGDPVVVTSRVTGEEFHGEITVVKPKAVRAEYG